MIQLRSKSPGKSPNGSRRSRWLAKINSSPSVSSIRNGSISTLARVGELREFLAPQFAKWWLPERFEFIEAIPKTSVGKFRKTELREMFTA